MTNRLFWNVPIGRPNALRSLTVVERHLEACLRGGDAADGEREALGHEVGHQLREARAFLAEEVLGREVQVVEEQLGGVVGVLADLLDLAAAREALHVALDDDHREALVRVVARADGRGRRGRVDAIRDKRLAAVDDPAVAVLDRPGLDAGEVGSGAGLGHGERDDEVAGRDAGNQRWRCSSLACASRYGRPRSFTTLMPITELMTPAYAASSLRIAFRRKSRRLRRRTPRGSPGR